MAKKQVETKKVDYKEEGIEDLFDDCSVLEAEFTILTSDGEQKVIKVVSPHSSWRKGSKDSGKGDNLHLGGAGQLPDGLGKVQLGCNLTPWKSKDHYGITKK